MKLIANPARKNLLLMKDYALKTAPDYRQDNKPASASQPRQVNCQGRKGLEGQLGSNLHTPSEVDNPCDLSRRTGINAGVWI